MLKDLIFVLGKLKEAIEKYSLPSTYSQYSATLNQIQQASTPELQTSLKDLKDTIKKANDEFDSIPWSYSQSEIVKKFGGFALLGKAGYQSFLDYHSQNSANVPGAVAEIEALSQKLTKLVNDLTNVSNGLSGLADFKKDPLEAGHMSVELLFEKEMTVNTAKDLRSRSDDWYLISNAVKQMVPKEKGELAIRVMSKGSPLLIEFCGPIAQVMAVGGIFFLCLQLYERVLKIAKLNLEISKLGKEDEQEGLKLEAMLKEKAEAIEAEEIDKLADKVLEKYAKDLEEKKSVSIRPDVLTACKRMFSFVKGGGDLRYRETNTEGVPADKMIDLPDIEKLANNVKMLTEYVDAQRQLEAKAEEKKESEPVKSPEVKEDKKPEKSE